MDIPLTTAERTARAVAAEMEHLGVSQVELSNQSGIPRPTLIRRLNGFSSFTVEELDRIAAALGTTITALVSEDVA